MADRKGIGLLLVSVFVSASALGIVVYSVVNNSSDSGIVAIWENISGSGNDFYLNISDNQINNSDYSSLADGNTSIILTSIGWYRFTIKFVLSGLTSTDSYEFSSLKNGANLEGLHYIAGPQSTFWSVNLICFVLSDGDDVIKFRWYSHDYDPFEIQPNQLYNQVVLEYVDEL